MTTFSIFTSSAPVSTISAESGVLKVENSKISFSKVEINTNFIAYVITQLENVSYKKVSLFDEVSEFKSFSVLALIGAKLLRNEREKTCNFYRIASTTEIHKKKTTSTIEF